MISAARGGQDPSLKLAADHWQVQFVIIIIIPIVISNIIITLLIIITMIIILIVIINVMIQDLLLQYIGVLTIALFGIFLALLLPVIGKLG